MHGHGPYPWCYHPHQYRDTVLKAARTIESSISDIVPQQKWKWIRIHNISLVRYMGEKEGGLWKLREELEAENSGVSIPADIRWLGGAKVRARFQKYRCGSSSVVAAVLGEATFGRLCKSGIRLLGGRYEVDTYGEARLDTFCSAWGHVAPHCRTAEPKCSICAKDHTMVDHQCPVEGRRVGRGRPRPHGEAKCANFGGPRWARADVCAAKSEARQLARRWRTPAHPRRGRGAKVPEAPEDEVPVSQEGGGWARWRLRRSSSLLRGRWKSRRLRGFGKSVLFVFSLFFCFVFFLSLFLADRGEEYQGAPV